LTAVHFAAAQAAALSIVGTIAVEVAVEVAVNAFAPKIEPRIPDSKPYVRQRMGNNLKIAGEGVKKHGMPLTDTLAGRVIRPINPNGSTAFQPESGFIGEAPFVPAAQISSHKGQQGGGNKSLNRYDFLLSFTYEERLIMVLRDALVLSDLLDTFLDKVEAEMNLPRAAMKKAGGTRHSKINKKRRTFKNRRSKYSRRRKNQ
jgi:hypothetical protein